MSSAQLMTQDVRGITIQSGFDPKKQGHRLPS